MRVTKRLQDNKRETDGLIQIVLKGELTGAQIKGRAQELDAERIELEQRLAEAEKAVAVPVHPGAIQAYLNAVDRLQGTLAASDALRAKRILHELIDHVVVHRNGRHKIKGRLAALMASPAVGWSRWCRLRESNPRPTAYKAVALPAELNRRCLLR